MKNRYLIFFVLLLVFSACKNEQQIKFPKLITSKCDTIIQVNSQEMLISEPVVYGINVKDTLDISGEFKYESEDYNKEFLFRETKTNDSILVFVDTMQIDFHTDEMNLFGLAPLPPPKAIDSNHVKDLDYYEYTYDTVALNKQIKKRKAMHFSTIPVYVYNSANTNRIISKPIVNGDLFLQVQAKNKSGKWKSIEYNYVPGFICGTGHRDYTLSPKRFIVSTIRKYSGNYKTKMRVKFMSSQKGYYSNEFEGEINYSQFDFPEQVNLMNKKYSANEYLDYKKKLIFLNF